MIGSLFSRYYWPQMAVGVQNYCTQCQTCQVCKVVTWAPQGQLQPLPVPEYCWQRITMNLITCLPKTDCGVNAITTFIDRLLKYTYFVHVTTSIFVDVLAQVFISAVVIWHGVPEHLISDHDPRFVFAFWKGLILALGAQVALFTVSYYQTDEQSERQHQSLEQVLHYFVSPWQHDWELLLLCTKFALNSSHSTSSGFSPAYMLYGHEPNLPLEAAVRSVIDSHVASILERIAYMSDIVQSVRKTLEQTADSMEKQANHKYRDVEVHVGDQSWLSNKHLRLPSSLSCKFTPRFVEPFRVLEVVTPVSFHLDLPVGWYIHPVFYVSQLKVAVGNIADLHSNQVYSPLPDELGEFEIGDILDVRVSCYSLCEFHVLWKGYSLFKSIWEPESHLENAPDILSNFCRHRNLPLRAMASSEGE